LTNKPGCDTIQSERRKGDKKMNTVYYGLTERGLWIAFTSKTAIRNCKQASEIAGETIVKCHVAPLFFQIFRFYLPKNCWNFFKKNSKSA
jgi:hypothetical protein